MLLGAEVFLQKSKWIKQIKGKKVAYLGNVASVTKTGELTLNLLLNNPDIQISSIFSPQHGFSGVKQANMITSQDGHIHNIPLFSLYSEKTRRLTPEMKNTFEVLLVDLQDVGCRIYTYLTTLFYLLEDCENDKTIIILDRPNPLGRYVEGNLLNTNYKSFVGEAPIPMSHGLTLGEIAFWFKDYKKLKTSLEIVPMKGYSIQEGWPQERPWILPSPNMTGIDCAKCYPGTVLLEGTTISEGRGTTKPLEIVGYPNMNVKEIKKFMESYGKIFLYGCHIREQSFEPTFDKFTNQICSGFQIHLDKLWKTRGDFHPYRFISLFLKAFHNTHPESSWKIDPPYEYEYDKLPIDIISGSDKLRKWVESYTSSIREWDEFLTEEEEQWKKQRQNFLIYK